MLWMVVCGPFVNEPYDLNHCQSINLTPSRAVCNGNSHIDIHTAFSACMRTLLPEAGISGRDK